MNIKKDGKHAMSKNIERERSWTKGTQEIPKNVDRQVDASSEVGI
jgi:hypothetical protein